MLIATLVPRLTGATSASLTSTLTPAWLAYKVLALLIPLITAELETVAPDKGFIASFTFLPVTSNSFVDILVPIPSVSCWESTLNNIILPSS